MDALNTEKVLLFHFKEEAQLKAVQMALGFLQVPARVVRKEEYGMSIGRLVAGESILVGDGRKTPELDDQMIVFAGLKEDKLNGILSLLRSNPECGKIPYKAVLTQTNQEWNAYMLLRELQKERAAVEAARERKA